MRKTHPPAPGPGTVVLTHKSARFLRLSRPIAPIPLPPCGPGFRIDRSIAVSAPVVIPGDPYPAVVSTTMPTPTPLIEPGPLTLPFDTLTASMSISTICSGGAPMARARPAWSVISDAQRELERECRE